MAINKSIVGVGGGGTSNYDDLENKPTLGSAAAANTTDFATAAQGTKADNALPKSGGTVAGTLNYYNSTSIYNNITSNMNLSVYDSFWLNYTSTFSITLTASGAPSNKAWVKSLRAKFTHAVSVTWPIDWDWGQDGPPAAPSAGTEMEIIFRSESNTNTVRASMTWRKDP